MLKTKDLKLLIGRWYSKLIVLLGLLIAYLGISISSSNNDIGDFISRLGLIIGAIGVICHGIGVVKDLKNNSKKVEKHGGKN